MNQRIRYGLVAALVIAANAVWAAPADLAQTPLSVTQTVRPMVLLALSKDHQLYRKAYNDYSDLDGDGTIETTYKNSYAYYGYFDPDKCYLYSITGYFTPVGAAITHQCNQPGQTGGTWSGNLLTWAAMTRMDILRRVLYGGYRSVDTATTTDTQTILERALLPTDAHAFAKAFAPGSATDLALYTPYTSGDTITFCNVTYPNANVESQSLNTTTYPPLIRIAAGPWPMWATGEVIECAWREERVAASRPTSENAIAPLKSDNGSPRGDFNARVAVCVSGLLEDNCRDYKDDSGKVRNKPSGLIQKYGENGSLRFGLMSGSYTMNISGGVLRRKIGLVAGNTTANASLDEINLKTGVFTGNPGIIKTINTLRINKYNYSSHNYSDCNTYGIPTCTSSPSSSPCFKDGVCTLKSSAACD